MKKLFFTALLLLTVSCVQDIGKGFGDFNNAQELRQFFSWEKGSPKMISAHRGGPAIGFPENCIPTFDNAVLDGALIIECDVRTSNDGFLVLMHDETLERTSTGRGFVSDWNLKELLEFRLKDPDENVTDIQIPLFGEVLDWAKGKAVLTVDVKNDVEPSHLVNVIHKHRAEGNVIIIVYNFEDMMRFYNLAPELMISVSAGSMESAEKLFTYPVPKDRLVVFTGVSEPTPQLIDKLHEEKIFTILGTMHNLDNKAKVNGSIVYKQLFWSGLDILSTDNVPMVSRAIREMKKR